MTDGGHRERPVFESLYRRALVVFPREFRERYSEQMVQAFRDASAAVRHDIGGMSVFLVRARMFAEALFGGARERVSMWREERHHQHLSFVPQDLKYALRRLANEPGFGMVAVLTLAVGIGANTAIFSIVNAVLIRNRPYRSPHELVHIYTHVDRRSEYANSSYQDLLDLRTLDDAFSGVGAYSGRLSRVTENDEARPVFVEAVTQNLFPVLGLEAQLGRVFLPEEDVAPGDHPVAILGHSYWQRRYAEDPSVLGETISLGGSPYTIVGVMPASLESLMLPGVRTDLFVPMKMAAFLSREADASMYTDRTALDVKIIGRLRDGVNPELARTRIEALSRRLDMAYPGVYEGRSFNVVPTLDVVIQPDFDSVVLVPIAALLMTMVGLVLLLTCTNLASLLLARGVERTKEFAVRIALGARRSRIVIQLLTETLLLCSFGGVLGLLLARWMLDLLTSVQPPFWVPITINHNLDWTVLIFTGAVTVTAGILAGLAPALRSRTSDVTPTLKGDTVTGKQRRFTLRNILVAVQLALSTVLLVAGGLFNRSLQEARHADPGFTTRDAGIVWLDLSVSGVPESEWSIVTGQLTERFAALPGVETVGASNGIPLATGAWSAQFDIPGVEPPSEWEHHLIRYYCIDESFFGAMGIGLVAGRGITTADALGSELVVVVSEEAARRFWPGEDPLGKVITSVESNLPVRVVGVAANIKLDRLDEPPQPLFYLSRGQHQAANVLFIARGATSPVDLAAGMRQVIRNTDRDLVIMTTSTLEEQMQAMLFPFRAAAGLLASFGALALVLAAVGLYGVVSFAVSRRTREVGIRMSLGAEARGVTSLLIRSAFLVVIAGVAFGLITAVGVAQFLRGFLIGVEPHDAATLVGVPALLCSIALIAAYVPARRASRVNPINALRCE